MKQIILILLLAIAACLLCFYGGRISAKKDDSEKADLTLLKMSLQKNRILEKRNDDLIKLYTRIRASDLADFKTKIQRSQKADTNYHEIKRIDLRAYNEPKLDSLIGAIIGR